MSELGAGAQRRPSESNGDMLETAEGDSAISNV
jgi:hypothetical protein